MADVSDPIPSEAAPSMFRVKAFSQQADAGSEAGVCLDAGGLSDSDCQAMAATIGASTTAFCSIQRDGVAIRFFTPRAASSICIHALVASAHVLSEGGLLASASPVTFRAVNDDYRVRVAPDGLVSVQVPDPVIGEQVSNTAALARALGTTVENIGPTPVLIAGTGKPKLLVPMQTLAALHAIDVDASDLKQVCIEHRAEGAFLFVAETFDDRALYHGRHFNPLTLDREDPICGIGSGALAAYLGHFDLLRQRSFGIEQGVSTDNPGIVHVDSDADSGISVGGYAVIFERPGKFGDGQVEK